MDWVKVNTQPAMLAQAPTTATYVAEVSSGWLRLEIVHEALGRMLTISHKGNDLGYRYPTLEEVMAVRDQFAHNKADVALVLPTRDEYESESTALHMYELRDPWA